MTHNQIDYWNLQELKRSNLAKEAENYRSHKATEDIGYIGAYETIRHNVASEDISRQDLSERIRHNTVSEGETIRSDLAREAENYRHNVAAEDIQKQQIGLGYSQLSESRRQYDLSLEQQKYEFNQKNINDRWRAAAASTQAAVAQDRYAEEYRHHQVEEAQGWVNLGIRGLDDVVGLVLPFIGGKK